MKFTSLLAATVISSTSPHAIADIFSLCSDTPRTVDNYVLCRVDFTEMDYNGKPLEEATFGIIRSIHISLDFRIDMNNLDQYVSDNFIRYKGLWADIDIETNGTPIHLRAALSVDLDLMSSEYPPVVYDGSIRVNALEGNLPN